MPKTILTPRDELICGKIDAALAHARPWRDVKFIHWLEDIQRDAERMEAALVRRRDEVGRLTEERKIRVEQQVRMFEALSAITNATNLDGAKLSASIALTVVQELTKKLPQP